MQDPSEFRTNRNLFSNHYLDKHLPETDAWESVDTAELQDAYDDIVDLWESERDLVADRNESQLEEVFIRAMFKLLDIPYEVEESVERGERRPDYGFFFRTVHRRVAVRNHLSIPFDLRDRRVRES